MRRQASLCDQGQVPGWLVSCCRLAQMPPPLLAKYVSRSRVRKALQHETGKSVKQEVADGFSGLLRRDNGTWISRR